MKDLVIDFETYDPHLKTYGAGWVFKYHYPEYEFEVLGCSVSFLDSNAVEYLDLTDKNNIVTLWNILKQSRSLIMHNASYDLGCLKVLFREEFVTDEYKIWDTLVLLRVHHQHLGFEGGYSLDNATQYYKLVAKQSSLLHDYAWNNELYQKAQYEKTGRHVHTRPSDNLLEEFCKKDMRIFPVPVVAEYANTDVKATKELFKFLFYRLSYVEDREQFSDIVKVCFDMKLRGVRIDLNACKEARKQLADIASNAEMKVMEYFQDEFNIDSATQLAERLEARGYKIPKTEKGNYSLKKEWLEEQHDPIFKEIVRYRKANKNNRDLIKKLLDYQKAIPEKYRNKDYGMLYPSLHIYGAVATGRDSSGGGKKSKEISIHQVPRRDPELGKICRALFVAYENETLCVADFSSQESRLQVHYASLIGCRGADKIVADWNADPNMKYHQAVADYTNLNYDDAKQINLGLSYGMGVYKLSQALNKSKPVTEAILAQYHNMLPFMSQLQEVTAMSLKKNGYIKTIDGRRLNIDPAFGTKTQEHKALSKLIQGSAAGQCKKSMIKCYKAGLKIVLVVHDELAISSENPNKQKEKLKSCMENAYKLRVPVVAEVGTGFNWNGAKV